MSKKRKKYVRPHYVTREERRKQAPKKPIPRELKWGIGFSVFALILAVVIFFALYNDGSLPMENGVAITEGDNWIIANVGSADSPKYYKTGEISPLSGFHLNEDASDLSGFTYAPDDAQSQVISYYVAGINRTPEVNAPTAQANLSVYSGMSIGEVKHTVIDGLAIEYFIAESMPTQATASDGTQEEAIAVEREEQIIAYIPAIRNTSVLVSVSLRLDDDTNLPLDEAEETALLESIIATITLEEKK